MKSTGEEREEDLKQAIIAVKVVKELVSIKTAVLREDRVLLIAHADTVFFDYPDNERVHRVFL